MKRFDYMRKVIIRPYRRGIGMPYFVLYLFDDSSYRNGREYVSYRFEQWFYGACVVISEGDDFGMSPLHASDSDESVASLMSFLCLQAGDTNRESFEALVPEGVHREFSEQHAEYVGYEASYRFEKEEK